MKNKKRFIILLLALGASLMKAQFMNTSTYYISNSRNCDITVHYEVSDCSGIICSSASVVIAPGTGYLVPCAAAHRDIFIWLKEIDYTDVTGGGSSHAVSVGGCFGISQNSGQVPTSGFGISSGCDTFPQYYVVSCGPGGAAVQ